VTLNGHTLLTSRPLPSLSYDAKLVELVDATVSLVGSHVIYEGYEAVYVSKNKSLKVEDVDDDFVEDVPERRFLLFKTGNTVKRIKSGNVRLKPKRGQFKYYRFTSSNYTFQEVLAERDIK